MCVYVCVCLILSFSGGFSFRSKWYSTTESGIYLEPNRDEKLRILEIFCGDLQRPFDTAEFLLPFVMEKPVKPVTSLKVKFSFGRLPSPPPRLYSVRGVCRLRLALEEVCGFLVCVGGGQQVRRGWKQVVPC